MNEQSLKSGAQRAIIALSGELLGFIPAAILVGAFCILSMGIAGVLACFFVVVASLGALPSTLVTASLGIGTHFRGHVVLGAAVPVLSLLMLYVAAAVGGNQPDITGLAVVAAMVMALLTFLLEVAMSQVLRWRSGSSAALRS